ncbi:MAG: alpha/beta fold hydrolase [Candidatus Thermoplasmatota archaeon]
MADDSLAALRAQLEALPQRPKRGGDLRVVLPRLRRTLDFIAHVRHPRARLLARLHPYPKPWRHVTVAVDDGVQVAGWLGPQHRDAPSPWGLVIVPGMFSTKDDNLHKRRAIHIHRHWKIPVLAIDLRAFGESTGIATAGWKEAADVAAAARFLVAQTGVKRVAVLAESMGAAAALNAACAEGEAGSTLFAGGVLAFSAFMDAADAVRYISEAPPKGHPFRRTWSGFRRLLLAKSDGAYERFDDLLADVARIYSLENVEELYDLATPKRRVSRITAPTLVVHSTDDPVVPVRHARRLERYAEGTANIQVLLTAWGSHTQFELLDAHWFWEVCRRFYGEVNGVELENLSGK